MTDQETLRQVIAQLERRIVDEGCIGDDEMGCTRDDDDIPLDQWCVNCLAGRLLRLCAVPQESEPPKADPVCEHGVAMDVHCCGCHSGFLFDSRKCTCF